MADGLVQELRKDDFDMQPARLMMGVIDSFDEAEATIADLLESGARKDHVHTWYDADGIRAIDPQGVAHGWAARLWRQAQRSTGEHRRLERYADELSEGHVCIGVDCDTDDQAAAVSAVLERHGGHFVHYLSLGSIEIVKI